MRNSQTQSFKPFDASDWRIGIVVSQFNRQITERLYRSVMDRTKAYNLPANKIDSLKVAGSIEIPLALQKMALSQRYRALVALGCVIRGETAHFDYVCKFVTEGILRVQLDNQVPIAFGILTCDTEEQAKSRADSGGDFLDAAMDLAYRIRQFDNS